MRPLGLLLTALIMLCASTGAGASPEDLMRKSGCLKCHRIDGEKKDAPSFKAIALKHKSKKDRHAHIRWHITGQPLVLVDDAEQTHEVLKTRNQQAIDEVVDWILSL